MASTTSRLPPNRHLVLRCKYCTRRFIGATGWIFFLHLRNHERNIKPYWYKNRKAPRVELKNPAEGRATKINWISSGDWKPVPRQIPLLKYASERSDSLEYIVGGKIPKLILKRSHISSVDSKNVAPPAKRIRKSLDPIKMSKKEVPRPSSESKKKGNNKNPALRYCDEKCRSTTSTTAVTTSTKAKSGSAARPPKKRYHCQYCPRCFPQNSGLVIHERIHRGDKPFVCDVCDVAFYDNSNLRKHRRIHDGNKIYKCQHCSFRCTDGSVMKKHVLKAHQDGPDKVPCYRCTYCDRGFSTNTIRQQHERIHTGEKPFSCQFCDRAFTRDVDKRRHEMIHTDERPYQCDVKDCTEAFFRAYMLTLHVRRKHTGETPYKCDICSKGFVSGYLKKKHEQQHTMTMEERKPFKCTYCDNRYASGARVRYHEMSHTNRCEDCGKQYKGSDGLRKHARSGWCGIGDDDDDDGTSEDEDWDQNPNVAVKIRQKIIADCESNTVRRKIYYSKLVTKLCRYYNETKGLSSNRNLRLYNKDVLDCIRSMMTVGDCDKQFTWEYFIP